MEGYIGEMRIFAGSFAPKHWILCHGQTLSISQYYALFAIIGNQYGGDGRNTFKLPDFGWKVPIGQGKGEGLSPRILGQSVGSILNPIKVKNIPPHTHVTKVYPPVYSGSANQRCYKGFGPGFTDPENRYPGPAPSTAPIYYASESAGMGAVDVQVTKTGDYVTDVKNAGGESVFEPLQPALALNYIICVLGNWPPRS